MDSKRYTTIDEIAVMNDSKSHCGVRRSRETEVTSSDSRKKINFDSLDHENVVQLESQCRSGVDVNSPEGIVSTLESSDHELSSACLKHDLSLDLKAEILKETEIETTISGNGGFRETSPSSEICLLSDEMESSSTLKNKPSPLSADNSFCKQTLAANTPTAEEIDEFFSAIEKKEQKRFSDKYNYDFLNDVPVDGRYQWVRLKP